MEIIYGTGNSAKISYMQRALKALPLEIVGVKQAADKKSLTLPEVEETGRTPLENARQKAQEYYRLFHSPVFSCDSGLYLWNHTTGQPLAEEEQPGVHVRGIGGRYTDDELLAHYITLVREYGPIRARYKSAICLIWDEELWAEVWMSLCGGSLSCWQISLMLNEWRDFLSTVFHWISKPVGIFMIWRKTLRTIWCRSGGLHGFSKTF